MNLAKQILFRNLAHQLPFNITLGLKIPLFGLLIRHLEYISHRPIGQLPLDLVLSRNRPLGYLSVNAPRRPNIQKLVIVYELWSGCISYSIVFVVLNYGRGIESWVVHIRFAETKLLLLIFDDDLGLIGGEVEVTTSVDVWRDLLGGELISVVSRVLNCRRNDLRLPRKVVIRWVIGRNLLLMVLHRLVLNALALRMQSSIVLQYRVLHLSQIKMYLLHTLCPWRRATRHALHHGHLLADLLHI